MLSIFFLDALSFGNVLCISLLSPKKFTFTEDCALFARFTIRGSSRFSTTFFLVALTILSSILAVLSISPNLSS